MSALWSLARAYLRPHLGRLTLLGALVVLGSAFALVGPLILQRFVDQVTLPSAGVTLAGLALTYCACAALQQAAAVGEEYAATDLALRATNRLRRDLFEHGLGLGSSFHRRVPPGALIQRVDQDPALLGNVLSRMAVTLAANALIVLGVLIVLCRVDPRIGLVMIAATALAATLRTGLARPVVRAWVGARQSIADLFGDVEELLGALEDLAGTGAGAYAEQRLERSARTQVGRYLRAVLVDSAAQGAETVFALGTTAALGLGALLYEQGRLSLGEVFLVAAYGGLSLAPLQALGRQLEDLQPATAAAVRTRELLATEPELRAPAHPRPLPGGPLSIEIHHLSFAYEAERGPEEDALADLTLRIPAGATLGVVGRTGSGKSTLGRLLARQHGVPPGSIRLGGVDITDVPLDHLRTRLAYVPQDVQLLDATILDNLTLYRPAPRAEVQRAIEAAGLGDWLATQPCGLATPVLGGLGLSAGEAQLLALARVFLRPASLVVLDEPSARLDLITQHRLQRALDRLLAGRTAVVIAHRPETLARATHLLVLEDGAAAEFGTRAELMRDPGSRFSRLLRTTPVELLA